VSAFQALPIITRTSFLLECASDSVLDAPL
jgi:hypothetical protein